MNYVSHENLDRIIQEMAKSVGKGNGLEDWQAEKEYKDKDICVYEGQIYRAKVGFTSDTTFNTTQILEEYTPVGGETIIPYEKDTAITIGDIVSYDGNDYEALYDFVCGEEFSLYALEEYVPQELTEVQEAEIINHFLPNIYSGGNMSIEDSTPIGTIIAYMGTIAPENYLVCDGHIYNIADYIELADFIKTQFGSYDYFGGDGITTFAVPDLQGEFLRMTGTNSHTNQGSGANVGVHQDGTEIPSGFETSTNGNLYLPTNTTTGFSIINSDNGNGIAGSTTSVFSKSSSSVAYEGFCGLFTTRPTNTSVLYCIKYKMSITNAEEIKDLTTEDIKQIVNSYNPVFEEAKGIEYSTEERRIGTWIDGKPLYQITIQTTSPSTTETSVELFSLPNNVNTDNIFNIKTILHASGYVVFDNYFVNTAEYFRCWIRPNKKFVCSVNYSDYTNSDLYVTLQYTKTTD